MLRRDFIAGSTLALAGLALGCSRRSDAAVAAGGPVPLVEFSDDGKRLRLASLPRVVKTDAEWRTFVRKYRSEMSQPDARHSIELLAALSHDSNFSVGCYCEDESHCHRSILRELLAEAGAKIA